MWLITSLGWSHYLIPTCHLKKKKSYKAKDFPEVIKVGVFRCGCYLSYLVQLKSCS